MTTLLFFDDNLLAARTNVIRGIGRPRLIPESIFYGDQRINPAWGYPGVFYHQEDNVWRVAYQGKVVKGLQGADWVKLLAESEDGLHWRDRDTTRDFKVPKRRFPHQVANGYHEWCGAYVDQQAEPEHRYKRMGIREVWTSPDALRWSKLLDWRPDAVDMSAFPFYNDVYDRHFIIARRSMGDRRMCVYQTDDWQSFEGPTLSITSDGADAPMTDVYGMPVFPYDGWYVGFFWLYHGAQQFQGSSPWKYSGGKVDCQLSYSLNGLTWQRAQRDAFIPNGDPDSPDAGCVYPCSMVMKDDLGEMWIYASASTWEHGPVPKGAGCLLTYRLRKDGFVYLEGRSGLGEFATKPVYWHSGELSLNVQSAGCNAPLRPANSYGVAPNGYLFHGARVQLNDYRGNPLEGYTFNDCRPFGGDNLAWKPTWKTGRKLAALKGQVVQIAVQLNNTRLYAMRGNFHLMSPQQWRDFDATGQVPQVQPGLDLPAI